MNIILISPTTIQSSNGNYTTAFRWKKILQKLGHQVTIENSFNGGEYDLMVALHAWRSAAAIQSFKSCYSDKPLIVALTGTDAYRFIHTHPQETLASIQCADQIIGLHALIANTIPKVYRPKCNVIFQSSTLKPRRDRKNKKNYNVCVVGHLRSEKDSLRSAYAARSLPVSSKIHIDHYGKAHDQHWEHLACLENIKNANYKWHGEVSQSVLRIKFSQAKLMVITSRMEGGANIISEAIMANLPVIASSIEGNIGLLGKNYSGYYEAENTRQLKTLLLRCERDRIFYNKLKFQCRAQQRLFTLNKEIHAWQKILSKVSSS